MSIFQGNTGVVFKRLYQPIISEMKQNVILPLPNIHILVLNETKSKIIVPHVLQQVDLLSQSKCTTLTVKLRYLVAKMQ
jgi:hypothetical protein